MKRNALIVIAVSVCLLVAPLVNTVLAEKKVLNILTWAGYNEDRIIRPFEEKYNCKVNSKNFSGDEQMLTIWSASKPGTWDVVNPDGPWVKLLAKQGKIRKLDPAKYPLNDLFPIFQRFPQHWDGDTLWGVASRWGFYGIAYNTKYVSAEEVKSWKVTNEQDHKHIAETVAGHTKQLELVDLANRFGMATMAIIPSRTTTISTSTSVNPPE